MNTRTPLLTAALLAAGLVSGAAQAALFDRGGGLIYDDVLNVTWLQDANFGAVSSFDDGSDNEDGLMTWQSAKDWAANLSYGGQTDWRLPTVVDTSTPGCNFGYTGTDCGYNVQTKTGATVYSELAYMYYVNLGLLAAYDASENAQANSGIFGNGTTVGENDVGLIHNLQAGAYWSGSEGSDSNLAWIFSTAFGGQEEIAVDDETEYYAWAVHPGDVAAAAAIPEAQTYALMLAGLGLIGWRARRRG